MKTIDIYRAQPMGNRGEEPVVIRLVDVLPTTPTIAEAADLFNEQGERLAAALHDALPGGTLDGLLAALFRRKASVFRVSFGERE